jgi:peptidoglycan/LPS O-acetylase OafA/YrhL
MLHDDHRRVFMSLDGLRGIAAMAVVTRHVPDPTVVKLLPGSYLAVDLFFVLSGFVLAHSYSIRLRNGMGIVGFMRLRLIRLYPLYILGTALLIPRLYHMRVSTLEGHEWLKSLACLALAFLFLPEPAMLSPDLHPFPLNVPAWSLFFELVINLVFAFVVMRLTVRILCVILAAGLVLLGITGLHFGNLNIGWQFSSFWGGAGRVLYAFFAGVAVYQTWASGRLHWVKLPMSIAALLMLVVFAIDIPRRAIFDMAVNALLFPLLVLAAARSEPGEFMLSACQTLGRASYAIYIMQISLILWLAWFVKAFLHRDFASFGVVGTVSMLAYVTLVALFLDRYYDPQARAVLSRISRRRDASSSVVRAT